VITPVAPNPDGFVYVNLEKNEFMTSPVTLNDERAGSDPVPHTARFFQWINDSNANFAVYLRGTNVGLVPLGTRMFYRLHGWDNHDDFAQLTPLEVRSLATDQEVHSDFGAMDGPILVFPKLPACFVIKTWQGAVGMLQITGFTNNPPGAKIRYKLVQNGVAAAMRNDAASLPATNPLPGLNSEERVHVVYVIASGDTVVRIARKFGMSVADLKALNPGLEATRLKIGQKIMVSEPISALLQNSMPVAANAASLVNPSAAQNLSFGPVMERVLPDQQGGQGPFMNFESGELVVAPNGLVENRFDRTLLIDWLVKAGADASAIAGENGGHQLVSYTRDTCFSEVSPSSWERMNESGLLHAWQLAARTNKIVLGNPDLLPRTFVFETRTGIHGILQITGFTENPRGVKIRYKLVQQAGGQISIAGEKRQTADEEIARLKLQAAEQDVKTAEARFAVGTITTNELQKARLARDIKAAETKGDSVEIARLKLQIADLDLDVAAKMLAVGTTTKEEYAAAKLARDEAAVYFRAAQKADDKLVQTPATTPPVPPGYQKGQPVPLPSDYERGQEVPLPPAYKPVQNSGTAKINLAATPDQLADLKARLDAARGILAFPNRDAALAVVARDAAKAGIIQIVQDALGQMTAFPARDKAALESARGLLIAGRRAEAIEIAKTITSFTQRDAALKELAQ